VAYSNIVISSGHGKIVRGASGVLDEVNEARRVVERVAELLDERSVDVMTFHDDTSKTQSENLNTIVAYHNKQTRDLDVSIHFNAFEKTDKPMGTEVLYLTQSVLAADVSAAVAKAGGFLDRGAKKRTDLAFLNNTKEPAILVEVCFVDSTSDAALYKQHFEAVCEALCSSLSL
jgi:N-acetylmuramoyl-L-alanine amidase